MRPNIFEICCEVVILKAETITTYLVSRIFRLRRTFIIISFDPNTTIQWLLGNIFVLKHTQLTTVTMSPKVPESAHCTHRYKTKNEYRKRKYVQFCTATDGFLPSKMSAADDFLRFHSTIDGFYLPK